MEWNSDYLVKEHNSGQFLSSFNLNAYNGLKEIFGKKSLRILNWLLFFLYLISNNIHGTVQQNL